jgi:hypothetical protein
MEIQMYATQRKSKRSMIAAINAPLKSATKSDNNTLDYTTADGVRRIRLHETDILTFFEDGVIAVNVGRWNTTTTRQRLNKYLPRRFRVFNRKKMLHVWDTERGTSVNVDDFSAFTIRINDNNDLVIDEL